MILTDGVHMMSDASLEELHAFASKIGLKRRWFQAHPLHPHYDLTTAHKRALAVSMGAKQVTSKELVATYLQKSGPGAGDSK